MTGFPTLGWLADAWIEQHCAIPDRFNRGDPFVLSGWQRNLVLNHYRVREDTEWVSDNPVLGPAFYYRRSQVVRPQKALALDTPVATPGGWSTMAELQTGDEVFTESGEPCSVVSKSPVWWSETFRVTFSDGASLVACGDHEWQVERRTPSGTYVPDRVCTRELVGNLQGFRVVNPQPLRLPEVDLLVDPYLLGSWLGDDDGDGKCIPSTYLRASEDQRWELLQGLMETSGTTSGGVYEFTTTSPALRDGVVELVRTLGLTPLCSQQRVTFTPRLGHRLVVDVQPVETVETQCLTVDTPSHVFLAGRGMIPTGNTGKSPLEAALVCLEGLGPALFAGWARGGEAYECADNGCPCGWGYDYEPGEPMGMPWPTPNIQLTATSVDQVYLNVYDVLRPMISYGPLNSLGLKLGEEFTRLPNGGRIDVVTSNARSRLGQRVTFCVQDESGIFTQSNGMVKVAETQRRGLAGVGGRAVECTNPWDPSEDSVAQRTYESQVTDVFKDFPSPPSNLSYHNKQERRRVHRSVYEGSPWVDLDAIDAEAAELMERDPGQAERFYGNRVVYGQGTWMSGDVWDARARPMSVRFGQEIVLGFDGSDVDDWTAVRAETKDGYQFTPTYGPDGLPTIWSPAEYGGQVPRLEVNAAVQELFTRFRVVRMYGDPPGWETEMDDWAERFGDKTVLRWATYRPVQMHAALERLMTDVVKADPGFTHDGCPVTATHMRNARKAARSDDRYVLAKASQTQKIDAVVASVITHEAAGDATAKGLWTTTYGFFAA